MSEEYVLVSTWAEVDAAAQAIANGVQKSQMAQSVRTSLEKADGAIQAGAQAAKTSAMTQAVGIDSNGKLWTKPGEGGGGGGGEVTPEDIVAATGDMDASQQEATRENIGAGTYSKPSAGIPIYDLKNDVQQSIARADNAVLVTQQSLTDAQKLQAQMNLGVDTAVLYTSQTLNDSQKGVARGNIGAGTYSKPSGGIPDTDLAQAVQDLLAAAATALQPPTVQTVTGNTPTIAAAADNTVYDCTGAAITAVEVTSYSYGVAFTLIFNAQVGTVPTLNLDGRITMPDGFTVEANRHYEINVDSKGYATVQSWTLVD